MYTVDERFRAITRVLHSVRADASILKWSSTVSASSAVRLVFGLPSSQTPRNAPSVSTKNRCPRPIDPVTIERETAWAFLKSASGDPPYGSLRDVLYVLFSAPSLPMAMDSSFAASDRPCGQDVHCIIVYVVAVFDFSRAWSRTISGKSRSAFMEVLSGPTPSSRED